MKVSEAIARYIELRDAKAARKKEHAAELREQFTDEMEKLEVMFLKALHKTGQTSAKVKGVGTVFIKERKSDTVQDRTAFLGWVIEQAQFDFLESRVSSSALDEWMGDGKDLPPGVKRTIDQTVNIRKG